MYKHSTQQVRLYAFIHKKTHIRMSEGNKSIDTHHITVLHNIFHSAGGRLETVKICSCCLSTILIAPVTQQDCHCVSQVCYRYCSKSLHCTTSQYCQHANLVHTNHNKFVNTKISTPSLNIHNLERSKILKVKNI